MSGCLTSFLPFSLNFCTLLNSRFLKPRSETPSILYRVTQKYFYKLWGRIPYSEKGEKNP